MKNIFAININIVFIIVLVCVLSLSCVNLLCVNTVYAAPTLENAFKGQDKDQDKDKSVLDKTAKNAGFALEGVDEKGTALESEIATVIQIVLSFLGVIFLILMIYGGFVWMTARGNEQQAQKAKNVLIAAAIGFLIVISAYAVSWLIMSRLGAETLNPA